MFLSEIYPHLIFFQSNVAFYFTSDSTKVSAVTYAALLSVVSDLSKEIKILLSSFRGFIGICSNGKDKQCLEPIILAIWSCECPIAVLDFQNPQHLVNLLDLAFIFSNDELTVSTHAKVTEFVLLGSRWSVYKSVTEVCPDIYPQGWEMCYALCTSGSTGAPKLVKVPWSCILPNALELGEKFGIIEADVIYSSTPCTFDPFFVDLLCALRSGAALYFRITSNAAESCNSSCLRVYNFEVLVTEGIRISVLQTTPSLFRMFEKTAEFEDGIFSSLRLLVLGGEVFPKLVKKPAQKVYNIYGVTELSCWAFLQDVEDVTEEAALGTPLANIHYRINDDGELLIGSKTRHCLVGDETIPPMKDLELLYRSTGDIVHEENKLLRFISRKDGVIKKFGTKISSTKIAKHFEQHAGVQHCLVIFDRLTQILGLFGLDTTKPSNGPEVVVLSEDSLLSKCRSGLSDLEKPDVIISLRKYPLTANGKIDVRLLRQLLRRNASQRFIEDNVFNRLWCEILSLTSRDITKSFKECGGSSPLAVRLISRLDAMDIKYPSKLLTYLLGGNTFKECLELIAGSIHGAQLDAKCLPNLMNGEFELKMKWSFDMKKCIDASPNIVKVDRSWFVVVGSHSSEYSMVGLEDGKALWTVYLGDRIESGTAISEDYEELFVGCYDYHVYCIAARTGQILWKFRTGGMIKSTPCLSNDGLRLYFGSYDKSFYCVSSKDGELVNSFSCEGSILATPLKCPQDTMFIATLKGSCYLLQTHSLKTVWKKNLASPVFSNPCLTGDGRNILVAAVEGCVHCLDCITGEELWAFQSGGNIFSGLRMVPEESLLVFGCHDKCLYFLDVQEEVGLKWKVEMDSPIAATPALSTEQNIIISASSAGCLYLTDFNGKGCGRFEGPGEIFSSPCVVNDDIFVGCRNDNLLCFKFIRK